MSQRYWPVPNTILAKPTFAEEQALVRFVQRDPSVHLVSLQAGAQGPVTYTWDQLVFVRTVEDTCLIWNSACPNPLCYVAPGREANGDSQPVTPGGAIDRALSPVIEITLTGQTCAYASVASHIAGPLRIRDRDARSLWDASRGRWITGWWEVEARLRASLANLEHFAAWHSAIFDWINHHWQRVIPDD